jgi:type II secretion system protein H
MTRVPPTRLPAAARAGFTLLEMLMVVTIMAIFAGSLVVSLKGRQDEHALRAAAQDLSEALRYAAGEARLLGKPCRVEFSPALDEYHVEALDLETVKFAPLDGRAGLAKPLTPGIKIAEFAPALADADAQEPSIFFGADGSGFSGKIKLKSRAGQVRQVQVIAQTGQVYVQ